MKLFKYILLLLLPLAINAQESVKGIHFEHHKTWKEILAEAKKTHKYVFVDCFTTWCGPCKYMSANVFTNDSVGALMDSHFISVKAQIDTNKMDDESVIKWRSDAAFINKTYKIRCFPTYLIFSPKGELVHRFTSAMPVEKFYTNIKDALDPANQYYPMLKRFTNTNSDADFLRRLMLAANSAYESYTPYFNAYVRTQVSMFTHDNIGYLSDFCTTTKDTAFKIILANQELYDVNREKTLPSANDFLIYIILNSDTKNLFVGEGLDEKEDITAINILKKQYPKQADEVIATAKVYHYENGKNWKNFEPALQDYMKSYGYKLDSNSNQLNTFAWDVFENINNSTLVKEAISWSEKSIAGTERNNPAFLDTYANLQYRIGNTKQAIEIETKALSLAPDTDKDSYIETLGKMKKGEKTWRY